ncbi:MAG: cytochrome c-type biogenesis protein [Acidimicrobiia bacterium]
MRRWWPWLALALVLAVVLAILVWPGGAQTPAARAHDLATELRCPECEGLSVADSNAPTSKAIRADIERRIAAGQSDAEIRQVYVDDYGEDILLSPQSSGIGLIVWVLPVLVLALGAAGIWFGLTRARREPRLHATEADEALVDRERGVDDE